MRPVLMISTAMLVPLACLGMLLLLGWLEETLDSDVRKAMRRSGPAPIREMAVAGVPAAHPTDDPTPVRPEAAPATHLAPASVREPVRPSAA